MRLAWVYFLSECMVVKHLDKLLFDNYNIVILHVHVRVECTTPIALSSHLQSSKIVWVIEKAISLSFSLPSSLQDMLYYCLLYIEFNPSLISRRVWPINYLMICDREILITTVLPCTCTCNNVLIHVHVYVMVS